MFDAFFQMTDIAIFSLLGIITVVVSLTGVFLVKRFIPIQLRYENNAVIGVTCALISVIYAVLAGITALYLTNNNTYTIEAVQNEASAVANLYRNSSLLPEPTRGQIHHTLKEYLHEVINVEWPLMAYGKKINTDGDAIVDVVSQQLKMQHQPTTTELTVIQEMLDEMKIWYDARQKRISMSYAKLNPEIWVVIFIGTVLMLFINYLFGMNFYLHLYIVIATALIISSMVFLLITLDRPFQGEFGISAEPFQTLLAFVHTKA